MPNRNLPVTSLLLIGPTPVEDLIGLQSIADQIHLVTDDAAAVCCCRTFRPDMVIVHEDLGVQRILELLPLLRKHAASSQIVAVTSRRNETLAESLLREGVSNYFTLPLGSDVMARLATLSPRVSAGEDREDFFCAECPPDVALAGKSRATQHALELLRVVGESHCNPVLILGETGTGKELAAQAVHAWRGGAGRDFIALNCAALTSSLLESELFGHVRGAFTGADKDKTGLFEAAGEGTIFLDEISEMSLDLQAKLLRVLQERVFRKVGGMAEIPCKANIIASSNRNLLQDSMEGRFRRDLYYRLAVFPVTMPALRSPDRRDDIPLLAEYFIRHSSVPARRSVSGLSPEAATLLTAHTWPGNIRELRNVIDRALILAREGHVRPEHILIDGASPRFEDVAAPAGASQDFSLEAAEREFILRALRETGGQRTRAAALLGITRATLHAKLKRYDIGIEDKPLEPHAAMPKV